MHADEILKNAATHLKSRGVEYDSQSGEHSMAKTVKSFNAVTEHQLTTAQGWMFMTLLKLVRSQQGKFKADSFEDGAAYFALMGEESSII